MLSHRNIIEMAFQMGKKDVIAKVMADAKMLSEKYLNDVDVQAKWMLCRLCDLEERFFDKGETISLDEVSEIKIEVPLSPSGGGQAKGCACGIGCRAADQERPTFF